MYAKLLIRNQVDLKMIDLALLLICCQIMSTDSALFLFAICYQILSADSVSRTGAECDISCGQFANI